MARELVSSVAYSGPWPATSSKGSANVVLKKPREYTLPAGLRAGPPRKNHRWHSSGGWTRESGRSVFGALKRRPAHDPATAGLPTHTSRFPPTHPETPHSYARRPKAAASAADASRSRRRAAETSLQQARAIIAITAKHQSLPAALTCRPAGTQSCPLSRRAGPNFRPGPLQLGAQQRHHRCLVTPDLRTLFWFLL